MNFITPSNITFSIGILGVLFTVYSYFRNPQVEEEKRAAILAKQVNWTSESVEKRFSVMQDNIKDAFLMATNHTHTVEVKVDELNRIIHSLENTVTKLNTIIDERIPRKGI